MQAPSPMVSSPFKVTNEIDWVEPLQHYLKSSYATDPDLFHQECAKVHKLRQQARAAGQEPAVGCDLLFQYYGQLELLELRFPVNEQNVKVLFTWFDAFTQKPTSQHSLAFEKACILYNIAAVLSIHGARQNRIDDLGLKTAYHAFQRAAGTFADISRYFLHAPSTDLNHETVQCLSDIMLAQAQEVCLEKQLNDGKLPSQLTKVASQAAHNYELANRRTEEIASMEIFDKSWPIIVRVKRAYLSSLASYYQALVDQNQGNHGMAIARLQHAAREATVASMQAKSLNRRLPSEARLPAESSLILDSKIQQHTKVIEKASVAANKDNDLIYNEVIPSEQSLPAIPMLPAAKSVPFNELYTPEEVHRIVGPDVFKKIVPLQVTQSASIYDEKKAELLRTEEEQARDADDVIGAALKKFNLPQCLEALKTSPDLNAFRMPSKLVEEISNLADKHYIDEKVVALRHIKYGTTNTLHTISAQLAKEETVCEQMRSKYGGQWTQQPSAPLTATVRQDIENYRNTLHKAAESDAGFLSTWGQYEGKYVELLHALAAGDLDALFRRYVSHVQENHPGLRAGSQTRDSQGTLLDDLVDDGTAAASDKLARVEDILHRLTLLQKDRGEVLHDLKDEVHEDDITELLVWNGHSLEHVQEEIFQTELDKFRPLQMRLVRSKHSQDSLLRQLDTAHPDLMRDQQIREKQRQSAHLEKQKQAAIMELNKICAEFDVLMTGLIQAEEFYKNVQVTMGVLVQNVETFVQNRKNEGAEILRGIELAKQQTSASVANQQSGDMARALERMTISDGHSAASQFNISQPVSSPNVQSFPRHYLHTSASASTTSPQVCQNTGFNASNITSRTSESVPSPYAHSHTQTSSDYHNSYYQLYSRPPQATNPPPQHPARVQTHPAPNPAKRASMPVYTSQSHTASHQPNFVPSMSHSPPPIAPLESAGPTMESPLANKTSTTTYSTYPPAAVSSSHGPSHQAFFNPEVFANHGWFHPPSYRQPHQPHIDTEPLSATGTGVAAPMVTAPSTHHYQTFHPQDSVSTSAAASQSMPPVPPLPKGRTAIHENKDDPWADLNRWG